MVDSFVSSQNAVSLVALPSLLDFLLSDVATADIFFPATKPSEMCTFYACHVRRIGENRYVDCSCVSNRRDRKNASRCRKKFRANINVMKIQYENS